MRTGDLHVHDIRTGARLASLDPPPEYADSCAWMVLWGAPWQLFALYADTVLAEWNGAVGPDGRVVFTLRQVHELHPSNRGDQRFLEDDVFFVSYAEGRLAACFESGCICIYDVATAKVSNARRPPALPHSVST